MKPNAEERCSAPAAGATRCRRGGAPPEPFEGSPRLSLRSWTLAMRDLSKDCSSPPVRSWGPSTSLSSDTSSA